jgi:plasmid stabilization system protein ParE
MTYRVVITAAAKQNLRSAFIWAAERAPQTAALWLERFEAELQTLSKFPERYQLAAENAFVEPEIRQLIYGRRHGAFRVLYTIVGNEVQVLHIRRATQDWASAEDLNVES